MGTHGLYGYILNGLYYLMYEHYDGDMLLSVMKREAYVILKHYGNIEQTRTEFKKIRYVVDGIIPTERLIDKLKPWTNLAVDIQSTKSWYCLLYHCQKSLIYTLNSGFILTYDQNQPSYDFSNIMYYMCWWNLDTNIIEYYCDDELIQTLNPLNLVENVPKNFPKKTFDEIHNDFIDNYNREITEVINLQNLLIFAETYFAKQSDQSVQTAQSALLDQLNQSTLSNQLNQSTLSEQTAQSALMYELSNLYQCEFNKSLSKNIDKSQILHIINNIKYKIRNIKENSGGRYINNLWKNLGVIHYE
jgi:hypothetical protein